MCGPLTATHWVASTWLLTIGVEEGYLMLQSFTLWRSNRQAMLFAAALTLLASGCLLRLFQRDAHLRPSAFVSSSFTQVHVPPPPPPPPPYHHP